MKIKVYLLALATLFVVASCDKEDDISLFKSASEDIVFQYEYVNYAWGKSHHGLLVTGDGTIYKYENPKEWNFAKDDVISIGDFQKNIASLQKAGTTDAVKVKEMQSAILKVDQKQLSEARMVMADAGTETYAVYLKNTGKDSFQRVVLLECGDVYRENGDDDAVKIVSWMKEINGGGIFSNENFK